MEGCDCNIDFKCIHLKIHESKNPIVKNLYSCELLRLPLTMGDNFNLTCEADPLRPGFYVNPCEFKE